MPIPIIGISDEFLIAFINHAAKEQFAAENFIDLGDQFEDYFDGIDRTGLSKALTSNQTVAFTGQGVNSGKQYEITAIPLTGPFHGRGLIVTTGCDSVKY
jgi:hypothetical protein